MRESQTRGHGRLVPEQDQMLDMTNGKISLIFKAAAPSTVAALLFASAVHAANPSGQPPAAVTQEAEVENPFVIGGQPAGPNDFPWQVALLNSQTGAVFCGGSYIGRGWIVTAAHCTVTRTGQALTQNDIIIFYGSNDLTSGGARIPIIANPIANQSWNVTAKQADIALLMIQDPGDLPSVRIPLDAVEAPVVSPGALLTLSGWGRTDPSGTTSPILMRANLPVVDLATCQSKFSDMPNVQISDPQICAGDTNTGGCYGDRGGPLSGLDGDGTIIVGIVSFGHKGCPTTAPTVFTRIVKFKDWINNNAPLRVILILARGITVPNREGAPPQSGTSLIRFESGSIKMDAGLIEIIKAIARPIVAFSAALMFYEPFADL
jgi:secreted trypsin-like serine protease